MTFSGKVLYPSKQNHREHPEAHVRIIMVDVGRVQRSLFPHLNNRLPTSLTEQEKLLVSSFEIVEIERHVPRIVTRYRYPGRKSRDRQALARAFVAKAPYRYPTISDLHRALQSTANLRRICGFGTAGSLPAEAIFSRAFATFAAGNLGNVVHDALVAEYLSDEGVGHISRVSTAVVGREKPAKKAANEPKPPRKRGRPAKGEQREAATLKRLDRQAHQTAVEAIGELPTVCDRGTKQNANGYKTSWNGCKLSCICIPMISACRSAPLSPQPLCMTAKWLFR